MTSWGNKMINVPVDARKKLTSEMLKLIEFFNNLEASLEYPNCSGYEDKTRILVQAEQELIKWGKV